MTMFSTKYPNNIRTVVGTPTLKNDDVVLECDTSLGPVTINLLKIPANKWNTQWRLYIVDKAPGNAAVNNITINAGFGQKVNNAPSLVINVTGGSAMVSIIDNTNFIATLNYAVGSGGITPVYIDAKLALDGMVSIPPNQDIPWTLVTISSLALLTSVDGIPFTGLKVLEAGKYEFNFEVTGYSLGAAPPIRGRAYGVFVNGVQVPFQKFSNADGNVVADNNKGKVVGNGILTLAANDVVHLRNITPGTTDTIECNVDFVAVTSGASIYLNKIDN